MASLNYGRVTALSLDPVEKKPLYHFYPGSRILSVGSFGCNLRCWFCQNHEISQAGARYPAEEISPEDLAGRAVQLRGQGNIGLAFTYNEPAVGWEYVRDASRVAKGHGLVSAMVTNGCFAPAVLQVLLQTVDAFNIDLKCFTAEGYQKLGGDFETVKGTIKTAAAAAHVEVTTLVVPGFSDDEEAMERQAAWLAGISPDIPLHLSRYFPRWQAQAPPTPPETLHRLARVAKRHLRRVYLGNLG